jgi:glutamate racemase
LIENNEHETEAGHEFIRHDVETLLGLNPRIDTIVLGCTHYPVLKEFIESIVPNDVQVVAQGSIVADSLADYMQRHPWIDAKCTKNGTVNFLTSESTDEFNANASMYIDVHVSATHISF